MVDVTIGALSPTYDVRLYGADPTGVADSTAAILAAVNACAAATIGAHASRGEVYFPPGVFLVTSNAVLTPTVATVIPGINFRGSGMFTSILRFGTLSGPTWFYDNGPRSAGA